MIALVTALPTGPRVVGDVSLTLENYNTNHYQEKTYEGQYYSFKIRGEVHADIASWNRDVYVELFADATGAGIGVSPDSFKFNGSGRAVGVFDVVFSVALAEGALEVMFTVYGHWWEEPGVQRNDIPPVQGSLTLTVNTTEPFTEDPNDPELYDDQTSTQGTAKVMGIVFLVFFGITLVVIGVVILIVYLGSRKSKKDY